MKSKASFIHERKAGHTLLRDLVLVWVLGFPCFSTTGFSQQLNQSPPAPAAPDTSTQTDSTNLPATTSQTPVPAPGPTPTLTVSTPDLPKPITEQLLIGSRVVFRPYKEGEALLPDGEIDRTKSSFYPLYIQEIQLALGGECMLREKGVVEMSGSGWDPESNRVTWKFSQGILTLAGSRASHDRASGGGAVQQVEFVVEFVLRKSNLENFYEALTSIQAKHNPQIVRDEAARLTRNNIRLVDYDKRSYDIYCPSYNISDINGNIIWKNLQVRQRKTEEVEGYGPGGWDYLVAASYKGKPLISGSLTLGRVNEVSSVDPIPAVTTPSPTTTATPVATNTPSGREAIKEALRRDPEFANMTDEQLDSFLDKIDHASLLRWTLADSIKAEKEYWESIGADPYPETIIRPATPTPPTATIKTPYDWIRHFQKEAELAKNLQQINNRIKDGLDADREIREARDNLRRQLEMLRNVRNQAMRNPSLYVPRPPVRR